MAINYNKLWKKLIDKNLTKTQLRYISGISTNVLAKLGKNEYVSMESIEKICVALGCEIGDILEISLPNNAPLSEYIGHTYPCKVLNTVETGIIVSISDNVKCICEPFIDVKPEPGMQGRVKVTQIFNGGNLLCGTLKLNPLEKDICLEISKNPSFGNATAETRTLVINALRTGLMHLKTIDSTDDDVEKLL